MAKKKTKEVANKLKRARTKKGRFVADNPDTPENEAFVNASIKVKADIEKATKSKVPVSHIREATDKAHKPEKDFFLIRWFKIIFGVK
jgi:hypothetical protein|tara:strand:- start:659 stop:922 length:264 start_codon:yes stop_codon:yes gene_type:complete